MFYMHPKQSTWFLALSVFLRLDPTYPRAHRHKDFFRSFPGFGLSLRDMQGEHFLGLLIRQKYYCSSEKRAMTCTEFDKLCKPPECVFEILDSVD